MLSIVCADVQVLLLLRQMEATNTQATASKVSLLMLGQQAVMDAYLCLLHLTTGTANTLAIGGTNSSEAQYQNLFAHSI